MRNVVAEKRMASTSHQLRLRLDSPLYGSVKGERNVMAYPWFDLDKRGLKPRIEFRDSDVGVTIEVRSGNGLGCPTIYDKDLILYCASILAKRADDGQIEGTERDRTIDFTIHDFLRVSGRRSDDSAYESFHGMLDRLTTASIKTNIEVTTEDGEAEGLDGWFSWFESGTAVKYRKGRDGQKRVQLVRVVVGKWLFSAIVNDRKILTYDPRYFELGPVERRLYDLARVHVGRQDRWQIRLPKLQSRIGDNRTLAKFLGVLKKIEQLDPLPGYRFRIIEPIRPGAVRRSSRDLETTTVMFSRKDDTASDTRQKAPVLELPSREIRHPALVRHLEGLGYMGCLGKAKTVNRLLKASGQNVVPDRELAQDSVRLADLLVQLGEEQPA
jgi:hypothetical protein